MRTKDNPFVTIVGDGPLCVSMADAVKNTGMKPIILTSRDNAWENIEACLLREEMPEQVVENILPVIYSSNFNTYEEFSKAMRADGYRAGIITLNCPYFQEAVKNQCGNLWFSACREKISNTFIPKLNKAIDKPTDIILLDNNKGLISAAIESCTNKYINLHTGVVHNVSVWHGYDYLNKVSVYTHSDIFMLIFPPALMEYKNLFRTDYLSGREQWIFAETEEEYEAYITFKLCCVNVLHTASAMIGFIEGARRGLSVSEIVLSKWPKIVDRDILTKSILRIQKLLYDKYLCPYKNILSLDENACQYVTLKFIEGLYSMKGETIGRALDPENLSFDNKMSVHLPMLRALNDEAANKLIDEFLLIVA